MNYYSLWPKDSRTDTYLLYEQPDDAKVKRRSSAALAPQVYALLGSPPEGGMQLKAQYRSLLCKSCGRYDSDAVFEVGFDGKAKVRIVGDFGISNDRIVLFRDWVLKFLAEASVSGYEAKSVGKDWSAVRISRFVDSDASVLQQSGPECQGCGRPEHAWGIHERLSQLKLPSESQTLFTTKRGSAARPFVDREIFMTEDVATLLKDSEVKGGYCSRLWTREEGDAYDESLQKGKEKRPPGTTVYLSGKPSKKR